jgi:hypothetical protein
MVAKHIEVTAAQAVEIPYELVSEFRMGNMVLGNRFKIYRTDSGIIRYEDDNYKLWELTDETTLIQVEFYDFEHNLEFIQQTIREKIARRDRIIQSINTPVKD